jgi:ornithine cyclodeaminase/alanine dehydrogenase-like protein (mu-crystallin family)
VSLRDLAPDIVLASTNIVDDIEHCLKAGRVAVPADRPLVFAPFGLGVLDLAVGKYVYDEVARSGELRVVDDFFHELRRYG